MKDTQMSTKALLARYSVVDSTVRVNTGYSEGIVATARSWGGKYDRSTNEWIFPLARLAGIETEIGKSSEIVEVSINACDCKGYGQLRIGWHVLASRRSRDNRVECFADLVAGTLPSSGGSVKTPGVKASDDAIFQFCCPRDFAEAHGELTIIEDSPAATIDYDYDALRAERDHLLARVEEIDAILNIVPTV